MAGSGRTSREERLAAALVELADTLADDFDLPDFLHTLTGHAVKLLDVDAAGAALLAPHSETIEATAWDEATKRQDRIQIGWDEGPCLDCARTGAPVPETALDSPGVQTRWPRFSRWAIQHGFGAVAAVPLRLRAQTIGALALFHARPGQLCEADLRLGQALADAAAIGILQWRALHQQTALSGQLQTALDSRIVLEQAKGMLAERVGVSVDDAFTLLRGHARRTRTRLTVVAGQVIDGSADPGLYDNHRRPKHT